MADIQEYDLRVHGVRADSVPSRMTRPGVSDVGMAQVKHRLERNPPFDGFFAVSTEGDCALVGDEYRCRGSNGGDPVSNVLTIVDGGRLDRRGVFETSPALPIPDASAVK